MSRLIFVFLFVVSLGFLWADPANPATATPSDEIYQSVRRLALRAGQSPPSAISPISYGELEAVLRRIDVDRLTADEVTEYRALRREVSADVEFTPVGTVGIASTVEAYLHTSDEADEWLHWYPDRRPLLSFPFRFAPAPGLGLAIDLDFRKNYPVFVGYEDRVVNADPFTNIFSDLRETDVQFPFYGLLTAAGSGWSLQFGRSRIGWGLGHTGSLLLSDHVDYHDFFMASVYGGVAGYRSLYLDLEPWMNGGGTDPDRVYFGHRIELRPAPWISLAINEALIFHGKPMELRYLNPLIILHSWFIPNYGNSMINLELSVRPLRGLEVWAHFAIDQLQSGLEEERGYADSEPEAFAYLVGAQYVRPLTGAWLSIGVEGAYLNPWMYIGRDIMGSFTYRRRVQAENVLPAGAKVIVEKSLGYPSGPDYMGITGFAEFDLSDRAGIALDLSLYANGENKVGRSLPPVDEDDAARVTPSGAAPEYVMAARLTADANIFETQVRGVPIRFSAGGVLDLVRVFSNDHVSGVIFRDLQFSPYVSVSTAFGR